MSNKGTQHNCSQHNVYVILSATILLYFWMSLCRASLCWMSLCSVYLCWISVLSMPLAVMLCWILFSWILSNCYQNVIMLSNIMLNVSPLNWCAEWHYTQHIILCWMPNFIYFMTLCWLFLCRMSLSIVSLCWRYTDCSYAEWCYAECHYAYSHLVERLCALSLIPLQYKS